MGPTNSEIQLQVQNRMVEELASRHNEFETLTNLLEDILFRCDEDGEITLLNQAWTRKTGWPTADCIGKNLADYIENYSSLFELQGGLSDENTLYSEVRIPTQFKEVRTYNLRARRNNSSWYGSLADITDHQRAVKALQESRDTERKLSLVASRTDNLVVITDPSGVIEWVNSGFEAVTGYSMTEAVGRRPGELLQGPDTDSDTVDTIRAGLATGEGFAVEILNYSRSRRAYWVSIDCSPVLDDNGEILNFIAIEKDITERKQEEKQLRDSEQHYRELMDSVSEPIFECDRDMNVVFANPAWRIMLGKSAITNESPNFVSLIHSSDKQLVFAMHRDALKNQKPVRGEVRIRSAKDEWRRVELVLSCRTGLQSSQLTLTGSLIDIDERWHATQAILEAKNKAEELSEARTRFVANMSHEIRTPLNAIIGMSSVLSETTLSVEQKNCVDVIGNGGKALLSLVNDVLDLSKIDSTGVELGLSSFSLPELCEEAVAMIASRAEEKGLKMLVTCSEGVPQEVYSDKDKIRQILINLFSNSVKFTQEGSIDLHIDWSNLGSNDGLLRFIVNDSGIGIAAERIDSLFDAFTQADASITRNYGGTGLGLAICKQLAEALGGAISAKSTLGLGTEFTLELPVKAIGRNDQPDQLGGLRIFAHYEHRFSPIVNT